MVTMLEIMWMKRRKQCLNFDYVNVKIFKCEPILVLVPCQISASSICIVSRHGSNISTVAFEFFLYFLFLVAKHCKIIEDVEDGRQKT
jgi:hypothetical protein